MKLVLQIAGGLVLAGLVAMVLAFACVGLLAKGVDDAVKNSLATRTVAAGAPASTVSANFDRLATVGAGSKSGTQTAVTGNFERLARTPTP